MIRPPLQPGWAQVASDPLSHWYDRVAYSICRASGWFHWGDRSSTPPTQPCQHCIREIRETLVYLRRIEASDDEERRYLLSDYMPDEDRSRLDSAITRHQDALAGLPQ